MGVVAGPWFQPQIKAEYYSPKGETFLTRQVLPLLFLGFNKKKNPAVRILKPVTPKLVTKDPCSKVVWRMALSFHKGVEILECGFV